MEVKFMTIEMGNVLAEFEKAMDEVVKSPERRPSSVKQGSGVRSVAEPCGNVIVGPNGKH